MTLTHTQETHRRARAAPMAARIGQFTGALPVSGGVAPEPRHRGGAWAGRTSALRRCDLPRHPRVRRRP